MSIKTEIQTIIANSLKTLKIDYPTDKIIIEIPKEEQNGDYSTNISLLLVKILHQNPMEIAETIKNKINSPIFTKIEIAKPGFINFYLTKERLYQEINNIIKLNKDYGKNETGHKQKVNIEYVSANPTGILHIGHGRGATYGDNLSRIMSFCGYDVTREYYINDAGNQMNNLGISIKERYKEQCGLDFSIPEDGYHGKEIIKIAKLIYEKHKDTKLSADIDYFKSKGLEILMHQIKVDLDAFRVNFDVFTSEKSLYDRGLVEKVLSEFKSKNNCYVKEDALWLKTTEYGDEKDRVIVKSDGNYTYLLPDIAYHVNKINRGFDKLIDVFGADHHGYIKRLKASLEILGYDSSVLNINILQMVRLLKDGEEVKISKRTGKTITLNDLIEEVGINATRYFFASKSLDSQIDFDLSLAVKNSNENPVYYIEYANSRITSIIDNYSKKPILKEKYETFNDPLAYTIMNKLLQFTDIVISAAEKEQPHIICNYVYELATQFHSYYSNEKFITDDDVYTNERIVLLNAIKIIINNSLNLIGIIPREKM